VSSRAWPCPPGRRACIAGTCMMPARFPGGRTVVVGWRPAAGANGPLPGPERPGGNGTVCPVTAPPRGVSLKVAAVGTSRVGIPPRWSSPGRFCGPPAGKGPGWCPGEEPGAEPAWTGSWWALRTLGQRLPADPVVVPAQQQVGLVRPVRARGRHRDDRWPGRAATRTSRAPVGDTFADPGGWKAARLVAAWAVPWAGLAALSWLRPGWAIYVFAVLTAVVIGVSIWFALNPQGWRSFEDRHGPIRAVITFVLVAAIALLGLKRTAAAGVLLLALGLVPVAVSSLGSFLGFASLSIVSAAPVITGVLYLVSAHLARTATASGEPASPRPQPASSPRQRSPANHHERRPPDRDAPRAAKALRPPPRVPRQGIGRGLGPGLDLHAVSIRYAPQAYYRPVTSMAEAQIRGR